MEFFCLKNQRTDYLFFKRDDVRGNLFKEFLKETKRLITCSSKEMILI